MSAFAHQSNLSFVVVDPTSNSIVGGDFLFNYLDGVECVEHHHCMQPIVDLLRAVEAPARDRLEATGGRRGLRDHLKVPSVLDRSSEIVWKSHLTLMVLETVWNYLISEHLSEIVSKCQTTLMVSETVWNGLVILLISKHLSRDRLAVSGEWRPWWSQR